MEAHRVGEKEGSVVVQKNVHVMPLALSVLSLVVGVVSIILAGVALSSSSSTAATLVVVDETLAVVEETISNNPLSLSNMIAGPTGFMAWVNAWEFGPEEKWLSLCNDDIDFSIPALFVDQQGKDALHAFRKYISADSGTFGELLWTNTYGSYLQDETDPTILYATMTTFYRAPSSSEGVTMQIGRWTAHFNEAGQIDTMLQDVIYTLNRPTYDACNSTDPPATICIT